METQPSKRFSKVSADYAEHRWGYPPKMMDDILSLCPGKSLALDCGTGTGQIPQMLSPTFEKVIGIDQSAEQIEHAAQGENISYRVNSAEDLSFLEDGSVDLLTVGTAFHWFRQEEFLKEARRVLKKDGILAIFGIKAPSLKDRAGAIEDFLEAKIAPHIPKTTNPGIQKLKTPEGFEEVKFQEGYSEEVPKQISQITGWVKSTSAWPILVENGEADTILSDLRTRLSTISETAPLTVVSSAYIRVFKKFN